MSLREVRTFMEQSVLAMVSNNIRSKVDVAYFQERVKERPAVANALLTVEYPAKVDRWDGGNEDSSYALLKFKTTEAATYFTRKFPQHCLSLKLVANMPSTTSPATQADLMARKRLQRDQQTFSQRSLTLVPTSASASASADLQSDLRRKMEAAGVAVESVLYPVDCASVGLQEPGQCAVVTFGKYSDMKAAESVLKDDGQNVHALPPQLIDSCMVFVPKSTLEKLAAREAERSRSVEDCIQTLRSRFGVCVMYSSSHASAGVQGHWLRIRALCDYINSRVSGPGLSVVEPPRATTTTTQGQAAAAAEEQPGEEQRFGDAAASSPKRKVAKVGSPRQGQGQEERFSPSAGGAANGAPRPSSPASSSASRGSSMWREPEEQAGAGGGQTFPAARVDSDDDDPAEFFATCQSPEEIDRSNARAMAKFASALAQKQQQEEEQQQQQQQGQQQEEEEEEEKQPQPDTDQREHVRTPPRIHLERVPVPVTPLPDETGDGKAVSLPVGETQSTEPREQAPLQRRATMPRRNKPVERKVEVSRVVCEYLMERQDIAKALEHEFKNKITVELSATGGSQFFVVESLSDDKVESAYAKICQEMQNAQSAMKQLNVSHYDKGLVRKVVDDMKDEFKGVFVTFDEDNARVVIIHERSSQHITTIQRRLEEAAIYRPKTTAQKDKAEITKTIPTSSIIAKYLIEVKQLKYYLERNLKVTVSAETELDGSTSIVITGAHQAHVEPAYMKVCEAMRNAESSQKTLPVPHYHPDVVLSVLKEEEEAREDMFADFDQKNKCVHVICNDVVSGIREIEHRLSEAAMRPPTSASSSTAAATDKPQAYSVPHKKQLYVNSEIWPYIEACKREQMKRYMEVFGVEYSTGERTSRGLPVSFTGSSADKVNQMYEAVNDFVEKCTENFAVESFKVDLKVVTEAMLKEHRGSVLIVLDEERQKIKLKGHGADVHNVKAKIKEACNQFTEAAMRPPTSASSPTAAVTDEPQADSVPHKKQLYVNSEVWQYIQACKREQIKSHMDLFGVDCSTGEKTSRGLPVSFTGSSADNVNRMYEAVNDFVEKCAKDFVVESFKVDLKVVTEAMLKEHRGLVLIIVDEERQKIKLKGHGADVRNVKAKIMEEARKSAEHVPPRAFAPSPSSAHSSVSSHSPAPAAASPLAASARKTLLASAVSPASSVSDEAHVTTTDIPVKEDTWRYVRMCMVSELSRLQKRYSVTFQALALTKGTVIRIKGEEEDGVTEAANALENLIKKTEDFLYIESMKYKEVNEEVLKQAVRDVIEKFDLVIAFKVFEERNKIQISGKEKDVQVCSQHLKRLIRGEEPPPSASSAAAAASRSTRGARSLYEEPRPEVPPKSFKSALSSTLVHVIERDITTMAVDVIVNAANEALMHGGGVAGAIREAAGEELVRECNEHMDETRGGRPIPVRDNFLSGPGRLRCKHVMHAVGPMMAAYNDVNECREDLMKTVFQCLGDAHHRRLKSIALPAISSGIFGVPEETVAAGIVQAVDAFLQQFENSTLEDIYLVDVNPLMVVLLQQKLGQLFIVAAEPEYCGVGAAPGVRQRGRRRGPVSSSPQPLCAVCLEAIKDCKTLPLCQHSFCRPCIDQVFRTGKRECPMCRMEYE